MWKLVAMVLGMFVFGWALIPLYGFICEITGLSGNTGGPYTYDAALEVPDTSRLVKVNFLTNTNDGMSWEFWAETPSVRVHPGEHKTVRFFVRNPTARRMAGQAVPSVVPIRVADQFHKTECFCFQNQVLDPGETLEMPMRFIVDTDLPRNVQSISLSYALFDVTRLASAEAASADEGSERPTDNRTEPTREKDHG